MEGFTIAAISGTVISIAEHVGKLLVQVVVFVIITSLLMNFLPGDPFRGVISDFCSFIAPFGAIINTFIPVKFCASSTLFVVAVRYGMWLFKKIYSIGLGISSDDVVDM